MAQNASRVNNLKPFTKGDPRIKAGPKGIKKGFQFNSLLVRALEYKTTAKLRAAILKQTGQETVTYEEAILAQLVAKAAQGSAKHIEILYKLKGEFVRAEVRARREEEHDSGNGETGSTLLIKVVRKSDERVEAARADEALDITPESSVDAP